MGLTIKVVLDERDLLSLRPSSLGLGRARWALVGQATTHGSVYSQAICRALGIDPYEVVKPQRLTDE
jgi:hypothetical protein